MSIYPWKNLATFEKLNVPYHMASISDEPLNPKAQSHQLNPQTHPRIYQYYTAGGQILFHYNTDGKIELSMDAEGLDLEAIKRAEHGLHIEEASRDRFSVLLQVFDHPEYPLEIPFIFELHDQHQRYCAAAFCEQPEIVLAYLHLQTGQ